MHDLHCLFRQLEKNVQLSFIVKDCFNPFDRKYSQFDFASCFYCVQYCHDETDLQGLLRNVLSLLKPGGKSFIGQPPFLCKTEKDQSIIADTVDCLQPLQSDSDGSDPFYGTTIALRPAPKSASETGRPFTREKLFTFQDYFWSKEKVMENLRKARFVNIKLLQPEFPPGTSEKEKEQILSMEEPFVLVGAEKPTP